MRRHAILRDSLTSTSEDFIVENLLEPVDWVRSFYKIAGFARFQGFRFERR